MSYKFIKFFDDRFTSIKFENWCLLIEDFVTLMQYEDILMGPNKSKIMSNIVESREYQDLVGAKGERLKPHATNRAILPIITSLSLRGGNLIDTTVNHFTEVFKGKLELLNKYGSIIIQHTHAYMPKQPQYIITDMRLSDELRWPDNDSIEVSKWPNGTHWYATVGGVEVTIDGERKWSTQKEAYENAEKFLALSIA